MRTALVCAACAAFYASAAPGQSVDQRLDQRRAEVLDRAIYEHRVFLTCSALDIDMRDFIRDAWKDMVVETVAFLEAEGSRPANLAAFRATADIAVMLPPEGALFADVLAYCEANAGLIMAYNRFQFTVPLRVFEEEAGK